MPRVVDEVERRSQFVEATWRVIKQGGIEAATLRRVAAEAGYTTGALTRYFDNRDALFTEALRTAHQAARIRMVAAARKGTSDLKRLEAIIIEALPLSATRRREWQTRLAFFNAASNSATLQRANALYFTEWGGFLSAMLDPLVKRVKRRQREVILLQALVDGLALRLLVEPGAEDAPSIAREMGGAVRFYLKSLQARNAGLNAVRTISLEKGNTHNGRAP